MSGHRTSIVLAGIEFTYDTQDGLFVSSSCRDGDEGSAMTRQEACELVEWLQDNLLEREHARSTLRPFLDRPTEGS